MNIDLIIQFIILLILLLLSAFFSGSETAYFSLNHLERENLRKTAEREKRKFLKFMLSIPNKILITILTGNMVVNFIFASLLDSVVEHYVFFYAGLVSIFLGTILILIFGEMTPKNIAIRHPVSFIMFSKGLLRIVFFILKPIQMLISSFEKMIVSLLSKGIKDKEDENKVYITSALQIGLRKGILHLSEHSILDSFFNFKEKTAIDVMIPRSEIFGLSYKVKIKDVSEQHFKNPALDLLPVYKKDLDHIIGYINKQDLLPYYLEKGNNKRISEIVTPTHAIPQKKNLFELMQILIQSNSKMALVVDEYGGTAGIVTLKYLIERFLHFFYPANKEVYEKTPKNTLIVSGQISLDKLSEILSTEFESDSKTLAGLITETIGEIPSTGREIAIGDYNFIIKHVSKQKIVKVEIVLKK